MSLVIEKRKSEKNRNERKKVDRQERKDSSLRAQFIIDNQTNLVTVAAPGYGGPTSLAPKPSDLTCRLTPTELLKT